MVLLNGFEPSTSPLPKVCSLKDGKKSPNNSEHCLTFFYLYPLVAKWSPNFKSSYRWCCRWDLNPRPLPSSRMRLSPLAICLDCPLTFANRVCFRLPPSSLYTFSLRSLARDCLNLSTLGFPEFDGCSSEAFTTERQF